MLGALSSVLRPRVFGSFSDFYEWNLLTVLLDFSIDSSRVSEKELTECVAFIETDRAHALVLGNAPCVEYVLALKKPDLLLVVKPGVELLLATAAAILKLCEALSQMLNFDEGVSDDILGNQRTCALQNGLEVAVRLHLVFKSRSKLLVLHLMSLLL